jgi:predicted oxidoreductase
MPHSRTASNSSLTNRGNSPPVLVSVCGSDEQARRARGVLQGLAQQHGVSMATIALSWLLRHPSRPVPITGSGRIEALCEAVAATQLRLPTEDWYRVWQASMGRDVA